MTSAEAIRLLTELIMDLNVRMADVRRQTGMRDSERAMTLSLIRQQQEAIRLAIRFMNAGARTR